MERNAFSLHFSAFYFFSKRAVTIFEDIFQFYLLTKKTLLSWKKYFRDFHIRSLKMVWNFQNSGLKIMYLEKFKRLYLRNYSADRIEIWYGSKDKVSLSSV